MFLKNIEVYTTLKINKIYIVIAQEKSISLLCLIFPFSKSRVF
jgi:hypothetical protein